MCIDMISISLDRIGCKAYVQKDLHIIHIVITIRLMKIEFYPAKNETNICNRGLSFELVADFDFETAVIWIDTRKTSYPEVRISALGLWSSPFAGLY